MVLPIYVYGEPVLREETVPVEENTEGLQQLIDDMIETMHGAEGVGLAAPQVGRRERLFVVDVTPFLQDMTPEETATLPPQPMVCINPEIALESDATTKVEEGCLSIPDVREVVVRPEAIRMTYLDRDLEQQEVEVGSFLARVLQHEYDHLEGILFIDHLSAFRRRLLKRRLRDIARGHVEADYPLSTETPA